MDAKEEYEEIWKIHDSQELSNQYSKLTIEQLNALMRAASRLGKEHSLFFLLKEIRSRGKFESGLSLQEVFDGYLKREEPEKALEYLKGLSTTDLPGRRPSPYYQVYEALLEQTVRPQDIAYILQHAFAHERSLDNHVLSKALRTLEKNQLVEPLEQLFEQSRNTKHKRWRTLLPNLMKAYLRTKLPENIKKATNLGEKALAGGFGDNHPNPYFTKVLLLLAYGNQEGPESDARFKQLWGEIGSDTPSDRSIWKTREGAQLLFFLPQKGFVDQTLKLAEDMPLYSSAVLRLLHSLSILNKTDLVKQFYDKHKQSPIWKGQPPVSFANIALNCFVSNREAELVEEVLEDFEKLSIKKDQRTYFLLVLHCTQTNDLHRANSILLEAAAAHQINRGIYGCYFASMIKSGKADEARKLFDTLPSHHQPKISFSTME